VSQPNRKQKKNEKNIMSHNITCDLERHVCHSVTGKQIRKTKKGAKKKYRGAYHDVHLEEAHANVEPRGFVAFPLGPQDNTLGNLLQLAPHDALFLACAPNEMEDWVFST
jgi:hypothetical protein